jgi:hypothetical protein
MDKFLDTYVLPKSNKDYISLKPIYNNEIEAVIVSQQK